VSDGTLTVDMRDPGAGSAALLLSDLAGVADRIGALDGDLLIDALPDGGVRIRGELPCG
jgi:signal transduction histidine kinase